MTKSATAPLTASVREVLAIKPNAVCPDVVGQYSKSVIINMGDEYTVQDISDHPEIFRTVQKSQDNRRRLNALDTVRFVWLDKIATATVDHATADKVIFTKMEIKQRRDIDREPFNDGQYAVRPFNGKWGAFRISDNVRMGGLYDRWEAARNEIYNLSGVSR